MKSTGLQLACKAAIALTALGMIATASAQWAWTDSRGVKHYSDTPPPTSVPENRILKQPNPPAATLTEQPRSGADETAASDGPKTIADQNAEFNKRREERIKAEEKAAQEKKIAEEKSENCRRAQSNLRTLESGIPVAHTNSNGDKSYLGDQERSEAIRRARAILETCS